MGALSKKRSRSIDSLWRGNDALIAAVEASVGIPIGSDDGVLFIQDVGTKVAGRAYLDKNNGKMYKCITGTSSVSNDNNFGIIGVSANNEQFKNKIDKGFSVTNINSKISIATRSLASNPFFDHYFFFIRLESSLIDDEILFHIPALYDTNAAKIMHVGGNVLASEKILPLRISSGAVAASSGGITISAMRELLLEVFFIKG